MPEVLDFVNGRPVRRGTDSSEDLLPSVPEQDTKPKPKAKAKAKPKPKPKNFLQQLQNDLTYEFNQARKDPVRSALRGAKQFGQNVRAGWQMLQAPAVMMHGASDNAARMGYSAFQRMTGAKKADPSRGWLGSVLDQNMENVYRAAGFKPPSQQTRDERNADMFRRSVALNAGLAMIPLLGPGRAIAAATKLGKVVKGGLAFGANEAASQFLDDNTGGGFMDLPNAVLPKNMQLPGGLGDRVGQLDPIEAAQATFFGNVAGGLAVGGTVGLAAKVLPGTMRWLRGSRLKTEEVEARGRLVQAGALEDNGDGAYRPGPAVAEAAPQRPSTFAEADAAMRQRLGETPAPDPAAAELDQVNQRLAQMDQQVADTVEPFGKAQPAALPDEFDPALDPWTDFDPDLPEATDVLKTLDQLDPAVIRQMDEAEGSIAEMVAQAQQAQAGFQVNPNLRLENVAAPTDKVSRLYLEGAGEAEGWDQMIEALNPTDLRSLAHPSNSPELAARIESLTGKEWDEFTAGDIRVGMRAMSKEGRTVLAERLTGKEFMATEEIAVDPQRFQFKQGIDGEGQQTGASLSEEEFWNPRAEDVIEVWDDPADGKTYVVNGHNRLALAKRLGIPSLPVQKINASSPQAARAYGAISNISDGRGMPEDAARFAREAGLDTPEKVREAGLDGENSWLRPADRPPLPEQTAPAEATPMRPRRGTPLTDGLAADLNELGGILARQARTTDEFIKKQAGRIQERMTAAELEAAKVRLVARALKDGEARPNTTPIPELPEGPRVDPQEALADLQARGGLEDDSPAMRALEDELRLAEDQARLDAAARQDAIDMMKDAYGYDDLSFEEKKALGMTDGWDDSQLDPETRALFDEVDKAVEAYKQSTAKGAQLGQRMEEVDMGLYDVTDPSERGADKILPTGGLASKAPKAPKRPKALRLSAEITQPDFTLPEGLSKSAPRYGRFTVAFDSDLDRTAYVLQNDRKKPSKSAPAFRQAVETAGLNPEAVAAHGAKVKAALKELAKGKAQGELRVPRQPWGDAAPPAVPIKPAAVESEIKAIDDQITEIQRRATEEGC